MDSDRIKELQEQTAYPESVSVYKALLQVWNECQQEHNKQLIIADVSQQRKLLKAFLEHYEDTIDFLPAEPSELIDDYFDSL